MVVVLPRASAARFAVPATPVEAAPGLLRVFKRHRASPKRLKLTAITLLSFARGVIAIIIVRRGAVIARTSRATDGHRGVSKLLYHW